jgi:thioredoxin
MFINLEAIFYLSTMKKVYSQKELDLELKKSKQVLVLFYSSYCPYCMRFVPSFERDVSKLGIKNIVHVLIEEYDDPMWDDYEIPAVPTILLFEDGKVCKRLNGKIGRGLSEEQFKIWMQEIAGK